MDAYSISCTSPSRRHASLIYQDLKGLRLSSIVKLGPEQIFSSSGTVEKVHLCTAMLVPPPVSPLPLRGKDLALNTVCAVRAVYDRDDPATHHRT